MAKFQLLSTRPNHINYSIFDKWIFFFIFNPKRLGIISVIYTSVGANEQCVSVVGMHTIK